jgi:hypothetical protein
VTARLKAEPLDDSDNVTSLDMLEPQTKLGAELIALANEIDKSGIPNFPFLHFPF